MSCFKAKLMVVDIIGYYIISSYYIIGCNRSGTCMILNSSNPNLSKIVCASRNHSAPKFVFLDTTYFRHAVACNKTLKNRIE